MKSLSPATRNMASLDTILKKLDIIGEVYDIDYLLAIKTDPVLKSQYQKVDRVPLPLFYHSAKHVKNAAPSHKEDDSPLESVWYVERFLKEKPANEVLELGSGLNGDGLFLAMKYPDIKFHRVTAYTSKLEYEVTAYRGLKNYQTFLGDFKDLASFGEDSMDMTFTVETLSLCDDRSGVLSEVRRVLKAGNYFIVVDGYLGQSDGPLTKDELMIRHLVGRGRSLKEFETYEKFREEVEDLGFEVVEELDVTSRTMDMLKKYKKPAKLFFDHPTFAKPISKLRGSDFAYSIITSYLMPDVAEAGLAKYIVTVMKKV